MTRARLLAAGLLLAASFPAGAEDGTTCSAGASHAGEPDTIQPTRPGPWRQDAKLQPPRLRVPGTKSVTAKDPLATDTATGRRWVRGYRPATPAAQAAFDVWKLAEAARVGASDRSSVPNQPSGNYATNVLRGGRSANVEEEPIDHVVRKERYAVLGVDLRTLVPPNGPPAPRGKKPESDSGYDHHSGLTWTEYRWVKEQAERAPETAEGQEALVSSSRAPSPGGAGFDAIVSNTTYTPPDPILAVGPGHLVAVVNSRYQVWDKTGTPLTAALTLDQFFGGVPNCTGLFDPFVDYDEAANRFVMGAMALQSGAGTDSYLCVAATATNDPTGSWNRTSFRADVVDPLTWIDYPHMGIGLDAIYIAGNMFRDAGGIDSIRAFAVDKTALYAGAPVAVAEAGLGAIFFTAQPAKLHGFASGGWPSPGTPHPLIAHDGGGNSRIWNWSNPFSSAPVIYGTLTEAWFNGVPPSAKELGAAVNGLNDTGTGRWLDAEMRHGKLYATRNTACNFGAGDAESCVDWVEIDVSGPAPVLVQQQSGGAYGNTDEFRYYPDLSVDRNGNLAIGYTKSSASTYTQVFVTGREFGDPAGTLQSESLMRAGLGNYTDGGGCGSSCDRWGDYTGMTVDPDGCTFWYLGQYSDGGYYNWGTRIGSFRFGSCSTDAVVQVDKGTYTCRDTVQITVTDSIAIDAASVAARTTVTTTGGDAESIPAASWTGSDCAGSTCGTWKATLTVTDGSGADGDGAINAGDGQTITVLYTDPHSGHGNRSVEAAVGCRTRLEDGGYLTAGGCEAGTGAERYRDYMDGGEYIAYTFGIYNPPTAKVLTDVAVELQITGPAADKVTIFQPARTLGRLESDQLTAPVFTLYLDPSIDAAAFRMSEHAFNLRITSTADGFTTPQVVTQRHFLQADDTIVTENQCWNFESGDSGFVEDRIRYQYTCAAADCGTQTQVTTATAPFSRGPGCGSETRTDDPGMPCDAGGSQAFKSNAGPTTCGTFTQTRAGSFGTITDTVLYSPIFRPAHAGLAANGQPWYYRWQAASWYYRSDMVAIDPALAVGFFWDANYPGLDAPAINEVYDWYPLVYGYFFYDNQGWASSTPWDPIVRPANRDGVAFGNVAGAASTSLQWRWAIEVYDTDMGGDPLDTPATAGLAVDDLNLAYEQYHTDGQVGTCAASNAVVAFDRYTYPQCPSQAIGVSVLDAGAGAFVQVTVESETTGDVETFSIQGTGPTYAGTLPSSTADGPGAGDGILLVAPSDRIRVTYHGDGGPFAVSYASVDCKGGSVVVDGFDALSDNGDGDAWADTNETVSFTIRIRNETGQPLSNVTAIVDSDDPSVDCISKRSASFGAIPAGGTGANVLASDPFTFKVSGSVACADPMNPPTATFRVLIQADGFAGALEPQEVTLHLDLNDLPGSGAYLEAFTSSPAGWEHRLGPGDDDGATVNPNGYPCSPYADRFFWRATGGNTGGGFFCWQNPADNFPSGVLGDLSDSVLYSPVLKVGAPDPALSFDHEYLFGWSGSYRVDGARVDYRVNGGTWRKLTTLPYDGGLINNYYCNPLCNLGGEYNKDCFSENAGAGESIFNQLNQGAVNWRNVSGALTGVEAGDLVQLRWRVGSMRSSAYGISTQGGYGLDNVALPSVVQRVCDPASRPDTGCGVVFDHYGNLVQRCGDGDALVEPTERWAVDVTLRNSTAAPATAVTAELALAASSRNPAAVSESPASFGTIAAGGGTATATYEFVVGPEAACIENLAFDVRDIVTGQGAYAGQPSAFALPVGGVGGQEVATQSVGPLNAADTTVVSALSPVLSVPAPAYAATLDYDFTYANVAPVQAETQGVNPLVVENASTTTLLGDPFTISSNTATSAVVDWTTLSHSGVTSCTRVFLQTPLGYNWTLKDVGVVPANPYNVLNIYRNANGGPGQYRIGLEEVVSGPCKGQASLAGATMTVTDRTPTGSWTANARVLLTKGAQTWQIKPYGAVDAAPYDVRAIYDAGGPGAWSILLEENDGGGTATVGVATLTAVGIQCDAGCAVATPAAPPMADGEVGAPVLFGKGLAPNELTVSIDNATCSSNRAVVLYGGIGNYTGYQGAVTGCDLGAGPIGTIVAPAGSVWFNVIWVNDAGAAGHPGFSNSGARTWPAAGLCGSTSDDASDAVCN